MNRRLVCFVISVLLVPVTSCGGGTGAAIRPRYRAATGSAIRYHTVLRSLPAGRPGRTISAASRVSVRRASDDAFDVTVTYDPVHVAGEGGHIAQASGEARARFTRDARRRLRGTPAVEGDIEATHALAQLLTEGLVMPERAVSVGDRWPLPEVSRTLAAGPDVSIAREAELVAVEDGLARVEVHGQTEPSSVALFGVQVQVQATLEQTFRMRVADAVLVEMESRTELVTTSATGRAVHAEEAHVQRVLGTTPDPESHGWQPGRHPSTCTQRLRAMQQRFEQTPRNLDLDGWAMLDVEVPVRPSGQRIDEAGPILVGMDEETLLGAAAASDVAHTVTVYVVAPESVDDADLRRWPDEVIAPGIEIRRVVQGQVHPPSPEASAEVRTLDGQMHADHSLDSWMQEVRGMLALCDAAVEAFEAAEAGPPAERARAMREGLLQAYERCGCESTDLARLERTLDLRLGGPELSWDDVR